MPRNFSIGLNTMASARFAILIVAVALVAAVSRSCALPTSRILGGQEVAMGEFTFAASVRLDNAHICGGSIIGQQYILTAAHCVIGEGINDITVDRLSVRVGSTNQFAGGKIVYVNAVTAHPDYANFANDIAVLKLATTLQWTSKMTSMPIASTAAEQAPVMAGVAVAGWGEQSSGESPYKLEYTSFAVTSAEVCLDAYSGADESIVCLAHELKQGSCRGDAGNGGVYNNKLVAVSNFVIGACGARYPDVFVNVVYYADWIKTITL